jgi:DNA-binding LytR/AlgR family response regulator
VYAYLQKPFVRETVFNVLDNFTQELREHYILVKELPTKQVHHLLMKDIIFIESIGDYTAIEHKDIRIISRLTLNFWASIDEMFFCQCHKSYVINLQWAETIMADSVLLKNKATIPLSVRKRPIVINRLNTSMRHHKF